MTRILLTQNGDAYTVRADGHATGSVQVCAAVSTLLYTLAGYLLDNPDITVLEQNLNSGKACICFQGGGEVGEAVFNLITVGFLQLEKAEADFLQVVRQKK